MTLCGAASAVIITFRVALNRRTISALVVTRWASLPQPAIRASADAAWHNPANPRGQLALVRPHRRDAPAEGVRVVGVVARVNVADRSLLGRSFDFPWQAVCGQRCLRLP